MRRRNVVIVALLLAAAGLSVGWYRGADLSGAATSGAAQGPNAGAARNAGGRSGAPVATVITAPAEQVDFPVRRRAIGTLESPSTVVIKSRVDSQVIEQHVQDGQLVRKGDLLFKLDDRELQTTVAKDEATLARDQATLARVTADFARTQELIQRNVAARATLDQATADKKAAEATVAANEAQLRADRLKLSFATITAPIDGRVGAIRVTPGNLVSASEASGLVTITQIKPIRVSFTLAERDLPLLRTAIDRKPPAAVRVSTAGTGEVLATGQLDFVDSTVDVASGTISAKATFANEDLKLWPGQYVDIEIDLDVRRDTVMVPTVAVQMGQKGPYVFVSKADQTAEMRTVAVGGIEGDKTAIRSGLSAGERVIVEGHLRLADGGRIREAGRERRSARDTPDGAAAARADRSL